MNSLNPGNKVLTSVQNVSVPEPIPPSSQNSESTITLTSPSHTSQDPGEVPAQTSSTQAGVFISNEDYRDLLSKAAGLC